MKGYTHIWDIADYGWFVEHPDMLFGVPACADYYQATREHKIPMLIMPEFLLVRGTNKVISCPVCTYINEQIRAGTFFQEDIWDDLATQ